MLHGVLDLDGLKLDGRADAGLDLDLSEWGVGDILHRWLVCVGLVRFYNFILNYDDITVSGAFESFLG